jgi:hypothetical protein
VLLINPAAVAFEARAIYQALCRLAAHLPECMDSREQSERDMAAARFNGAVVAGPDPPPRRLFTLTRTWVRCLSASVPGVARELAESSPAFVGGEALAFFWEIS